jgi:pre-mRNA-splicing helicase BRR2
VIDLEAIKFDQGGRLMSNKKCHLPKGSTKLQKKGYDEIYVPAVKHINRPDSKLIPISDIPNWA